MEDNGTCETCGPNGLKIRKINGVTRVEVPGDFMSAKLGSKDSQVAQAMAFAEHLQRTEQSLKGNSRPSSSQPRRSAFHVKTHPVSPGRQQRFSNPETISSP